MKWGGNCIVLYNRGNECERWKWEKKVWASCGIIPPPFFFYPRNKNAQGRNNPVVRVNKHLFFLFKSTTAQCTYMLNPFVMFYDFCLVQYESSWLLLSEAQVSHKGSPHCTVRAGVLCSGTSRSARRTAEDFSNITDVLMSAWGRDWSILLFVCMAVCSELNQRLGGKESSEGSEILWCKLLIIYIFYI